MIKFNGSRAEYAQMKAERLRANRHDFFSAIDASILRAQLKIYQQYYPEMIEETCAMANYLSMDEDLLLYEELALAAVLQKRRIARHTHGCTIFAIHENDQTFVGRNYDWLPGAREFFEIYNLQIEDANHYYAFSDEGVWRRHTGKNTRKPYFEDAINEHGLYIGLTYAHIHRWNYGVSPHHMIRYVVEKCRTTREALAAFRKIPNAVPKNYLIADATGDIAVVEHAARDFAIVRPRQGVLVKTNHSLAPNLQKFDRVLQDNPTATSFVRKAEAEYLISEQLPGFQFTDIWRILRNSHYVYNEETIWSLALELSSKRFNFYRDTAMGQKEQKFGF